MTSLTTSNTFKINNCSICWTTIEKCGHLSLPYGEPLLPERQSTLISNMARRGRVCKLVLQGYQLGSKYRCSVRRPLRNSVTSSACTAQHTVLLHKKIYYFIFEGKKLNFSMLVHVISLRFFFTLS